MSWVRQMWNHWNVMLCQEVPDIQGHLAHCIIQMQKQVPAAMCEAVSNELLLRGTADSLCRHCDWCCGPAALGKKFVIHQTLYFIESDQHCLDFLVEIWPFLKWDYQSYVLNQLNTVSLNACCSILYISMVILPNFQQNLMQKNFTSAHSSSYVMKGKTLLTCRSPHSRHS